MTQATSINLLNRTLGLSLQSKRGLRNVLQSIYKDTLAGAELTTGAASGITAGVGASYATSIIEEGPIVTTRILVGLTGLQTSTTDLDIIGYSTPAAHLGQITAADNGTIYYGTVQCLVAPTVGADDIDLYCATEATGAFDTGIATLVETALLTAGSAWTAGEIQVLTGWPAAGQYLYLTNGEAGTVGTFGAGKLLITLLGYR